MICHNCGTANREGELICHSCGTLLNVPATTRLNGKVTGTITRTGAPPTTLNMVTFEISGQAYQFPVHDGYSIAIGRGNAQSHRTNGTALDLIGMGGNEKGVSRQHALIRIEGTSAFLMDLDSTNGTYLNGQRLRPRRQHLLYSGDLIRFGGLEVRIQLS